jgi:phosphoribosylformylglycinamidine synthase I/phosphoribosylaminoimidazole-succinocarboxamide synthase
MSSPRALVLRAPGINCDRETAQACRLVGFETELVHINQLLKEPQKLLEYHLLVLPGGFSYGDGLGAGTLLAKNLSVHLEQELKRFVAEGRLVLGICNGFQTLVRAGLLPSAFLDSELTPAVTLTDNVSARFECRWVRLAVQPGSCLFTKGIEQSFELPVAHGEGQFVLADPTELARLQASGQIALVYTIDTQLAAPSPAAFPLSEPTVAYPANPNGSLGNIAGVCNTRGNVLGLMPHPERFVSAIQHPQRRSTNKQGTGDGLQIFQNAYDYVHEQFLTPISYASSGVDIAAADSALSQIKDAIQATHGPEVQAGLGAFAGVFLATALKEMRQPALVASTDGVGTKTLLASQAGRFETIGHDIVNHSINDLLTQKATPLFFMDYVATGKLAPAQIAAVVKSVAEACKEAGCALLGGETAEMPGVYREQAFDLVGTIVGAVDLAEGWRNGAAICAGDVLLGLPSDGLHTNGYSLVRRVFASYTLDTVFPELGEPLADALLRPHRCYSRELQKLHQNVPIKGLAHITGGGFAGNISRILPTATQAIIDIHAWTVLPLFQLIARLGRVEREEMYRTFNMGVGMVLVLSPEAADQARRVLPELLTVGRIIEGSGVTLQGAFPMIDHPTFGRLLTEGKTKQIYAHPSNSALAYMLNKDQITAGDGARHNELVGKSRWSTITTANVYRLLKAQGIATHLVEQIDDITILIKRCTMLPIEQVQRRVATGSYLKRHSESKEGDRFDPVLIETFLKDDANHDPQIWEEDIIKRGLATKEEIAWMAEEGRKLFTVLERAWASVDVVLVDLKIEFGRDINGQLLVADVIDNDSWRIWPGGDKNRMLDKQVYRNLQEVTEQDLQTLGDRYALVADLTSKLKLE